ncbi:hypothetical protein TIFTF001_002514 [Ficus carica]|uniref:Uncharacterized protein n=1 Tax=Ficus carica TaxID=3494 RepID=A0AA87ZB90_FICCA|nr:hypothetical protein TIFTF001_002514 [Ficus carica]
MRKCSLLHPLHNLRIQVPSSHSLRHACTGSAISLVSAVKYRNNARISNDLGIFRYVQLFSSAVDQKAWNTHK